VSDILIGPVGDWVFFLLGILYVLASSTIAVAVLLTPYRRRRRVADAEAIRHCLRGRRS